MRRGAAAVAPSRAPEAAVGAAAAAQGGRAGARRRARRRARGLFVRPPSAASCGGDARVAQRPAAVHRLVRNLGRPVPHEGNTALARSFSLAAGGEPARETEGNQPSVLTPSPAASRWPADVVSHIDRRGSGSRGLIFRRPRLQKTVRVVAAHGIDAVRAYAVGGTAGGTSNGIVGSPVNGFGRFRPCPRRRAASAERARQR